MPYHGWSFDGNGQCQRMPQALDNTQPNNRRSCCASLPTATAQGLLFVWMGSPDAADNTQLPLVPHWMTTRELDGAGHLPRSTDGRGDPAGNVLDVVTFLSLTTKP